MNSRTGLLISILRKDTRGVGVGEYNVSRVAKIFPRFDALSFLNI